jgi:hypothetical protein
MERCEIHPSKSVVLAEEAVGRGMFGILRVCRIEMRGPKVRLVL